MANTPYLAFTAPQSFSVGYTAWSSSAPTISLQYSRDLETWSTLILNEMVTSEDGSPIYVRGVGNTAWSSSSAVNTFSLIGEKIKVSGNIHSILDYSTCDTLELTADYALTSIFSCAEYKASGDTTHVSPYDCSELYFPDTKLSRYCYMSMFNSCYELVYPPKELSATTISSYCYVQMFIGCRTMIELPILKATLLQDNCCDYMFRNCFSITSIPKDYFSGMTFKSNCCNYMFYGTAITSLPDLPAGEDGIAGNYSGMFRGCTSLEVVDLSIIKAETLSDSCCSYMFSDCTSLKRIKNVPSTGLAEYCFSHMFSGCTSLVNPPELLATELPTYCYYYMFSGCTGLKYLPDITITSEGDNPLEDMFRGCTGIYLSKTKVDDTYGEFKINSSNSGVAYNFITNGGNENMDDIKYNATYYYPCLSKVSFNGSTLSGIIKDGKTYALKSIVYEHDGLQDLFKIK